MFGIGSTEVLIFLVIVTVLFGSSKIPTLMRNVGRSANEFRKGMKEDFDDSTEQPKKDSVG